MKKRIVAMALSVAMVASLSARPAWAVDAAAEGPPPADEVSAEAYTPDPEGMITFENLERRLREHHPAVLGLEESIDAIRAVDFDRMYEDIRRDLNQLADAQWGLINGTPDGLGGGMASMLGAQYEALSDTFEELKDGKLQTDSLDAVWQLETAQKRVIMAEETLYIGLLGLEREAAARSRALAAGARAMQVAQLQYELGYCSAVELEQAKRAHAALAAELEVLEGNLSNRKAQLEQVTGETVSGTVALGALPAVSEQQLSSMDHEDDLAAASQASYSLRAAKKVLEDAEEVFEKHYPNEHSYRYVVAKHTWQAAQYQYQSVVQAFEQSFRDLSARVTDAEQRLAHAQALLDEQLSLCSAAQKKFDQGLVSQNDLLHAEDLAAACADGVEYAAMELFAAYNAYTWAVEDGIL